MKRANKCVSKRSYTHRSAALAMACWMYREQGLRTAVYECPTCLDFHLTTKWCNTSRYHKRWKKNKTKLRSSGEWKKLPIMQPAAVKKKKYLKPVTLPRNQQQAAFSQLKKPPTGIWYRFKSWLHAKVKI